MILCCILCVVLFVGWCLRIIIIGLCWCCVNGLRVSFYELFWRICWFCCLIVWLYGGLMMLSLYMFFRWCLCIMVILILGVVRCCLLKLKVGCVWLSVWKSLLFWICLILILIIFCFGCGMNIGCCWMVLRWFLLRIRWLSNRKWWVVCCLVIIR